MEKYDDDAVVLKHTMGTRLFHWGLILGFLPAAFTGVVLWFRPFGNGDACRYANSHCRCMDSGTFLPVFFCVPI